MEPRECDDFLNHLRQPGVLEAARRLSIHTPGKRRTDEAHVKDNQGVFIFPTWHGHPGFVVKVPSPLAREHTHALGPTAASRLPTAKEFAAQREAWVVGARCCPPLCAPLPPGWCRSVATVEEVKAAPAWLESPPGTPGFFEHQRLFDDFVDKMHAANVGGDFRLDNLFIDEHGSLVATDCVRAPRSARAGPRAAPRAPRPAVHGRGGVGARVAEEWDDAAADVCTAAWRETVLDYASRYHDWKQFAVKAAVDKAKADLGSCARPTRRRWRADAQARDQTG